MQLMVNGEPRECPEDCSLEQLLIELKVPARKGVAVALNLQVIPQTERKTTQLREGDRVDVVTAVGGG
jgi:sulfur carrier protein